MTTTSASRSSARFSRRFVTLLFLPALAASSLHGQDMASVPPGVAADQPDGSPNGELDRVVITATRTPVAEDRSPSALTVISAADLAQRQTDRVADALREVPGISVSQSGTPGQLTSVFTRGLESQQTQVLIDGIPFNQGLAGQFNFADLTGDGIDRIEVARGPQSTLYGPRAAAGTIQLFSRRGDGLESARPFVVDASSEGGSFGTFRERFAVAGVLGSRRGTDARDGGKQVTSTTPTAADPSVFDYSLAFSRLDTDNQRPNNEYRNTAVLANLGFTAQPLTLAAAGGTAPRFGVLVFYSNSDASSPNTIFAPRPLRQPAHRTPALRAEHRMAGHELVAPSARAGIRQGTAGQQPQRRRFRGAEPRDVLPLPTRLSERHRLHPLADADQRCVL